MAGRIYVGVGGWTFEPWRGEFYPEGLPHKRELEHASRQLTAIEINGTYYGSQKPESFARWRDETPDDFVFTVKGPRFATNRRVLAEAGPSIERFFSTGVTRLGSKLGPINWQFLPTKKFDPDDFDAFLTLLPREVDGLTIRHAVELRNESFRSPACVDIVRRHGVAIVCAGDGEHPQISDLTAPFVYARIMGTSEAEPLGYAEKDLDRWSQRAKAWAAGKPAAGLAPMLVDPAPAVARDVFLFVISGEKVRNPAAAQALIQRLAAKRPARGS